MFINVYNKQYILSGIYKHNFHDNTKLKSVAVV